jgi:anti-sigma factor RsiW
MKQINMTCEDAQELITALVDAELREPERSSLENHFKACTRCRFAFAQEQGLKRAIYGAGTDLRAPAELKEKLLSDPRIFGELPASEKSWRDYLKPARFVLRPALVAALLLIIALPFWFVTQRSTEPVALSAIGRYHKLLRGEVPLFKAGNTDELTRDLVRAVSGLFHPMGYDFSMMDMMPVGGAVQEIRGRKILAVIYQGPNQSILCYTFLGTETDAPPNAATFFDAEKRLHFYAFSLGSVNAVLHREHDVICILAAEMPMEDVLKMARSKARPS